MKDPQLDARIQAAYPAATAPETLQDRISAGIARTQHTRRAVRRVRFAVGVAGVAALLTVIGPPVYAQAVVSRIAGALDGVTTMRMIRTSIDHEGNSTPAGEMVYDDGRWRIRQSGEDMIYREGRRYQYDSLLDAYVVEERPEGPFSNAPGIRLSETLGEATRWSFRRRVKVDSATLDGRPMRRAVVENADLGEREIIFADPKTDLPIQMRIESRELDRWRLRQVLSFEYGNRVPSQTFEIPKDKPTVSDAERDERIVKTMAAQELATMPLQRGRLVIRALDVAADGTVFVAYQAGHRSPNSWDGYAIELEDDLGTSYARRELLGGGDEFLKYSKDGKLEVEAFVPLEPIARWQPRTFRLIGGRFKNGKLARTILVQTTKANGETSIHWQPNWRGRDLTPPQKQVLLTRRIDAPTCKASPLYAQLVSYMFFSNDVATAIYTAETRAKALGDEKRWDEAARWYEEEIRQMRRMERAGYGTWSEEGPLKKLEEIRTRKWIP